MFADGVIRRRKAPDYHGADGPNNIPESNIIQKKDTNYWKRISYL